MPTRDKRIDDYIAAAAPFARPILRHLREVVHEACPDVVETLKWRMPAFEHKGPCCGMAAFKEHAAFNFWKHELVLGDNDKAREAMGSLGRLRTLSDLPPRRVLLGSVRRAVKLNEDGIKAPRRKTVPKQPIAMHPGLEAALARSAAARAPLAGFPPGARREYLEWIAEAKTEATRARRIEQAVEWLAAGKRRHWKYQR